MARGRAWGNALGGWRLQSRTAGGQFGSGRGRTIVRRKPVRKIGKGIQRRAPRGQKVPIKSVSKYSDAGYARAVTKAQKHKVNNAKINRQIQGAHMKNVAANKIGTYGGNAIGMGLGATVFGPFGAAVVGSMGAHAGGYAARQSLQRQGIYIGPKQFMAMGIDDQAAIVQRDRKVDQADFAINLAFTAYNIHRVLGSTGKYSKWSGNIRRAKARDFNATTRGLPRAGRGSAGSFAPKRAPRYGSSKGVYDITTGMSGSRIR